MPLMDELREAMVDAAASIDLDTRDPLVSALQEALRLNLACQYQDTNTLLAGSVIDAVGSADEKSILAEWDREKSVLYGIKSGEVRLKNAQDHYNEWQEIADKKWEINPWLSKAQIAKDIVESQQMDFEHEEDAKKYSVDYIRRKIKSS